MTDKNKRKRPLVADRRYPGKAKPKPKTSARAKPATPARPRAPNALGAGESLVSLLAWPVGFGV